MRKQLILALTLLSSTAMADYRSINDEPVSLNEPGWQHLVFVNIWDAYAGQGPEATVRELPERFSQRVKRVWISPDLNITKAYLQDYQQVFPQSKPLIIDQQFQLMRGYGLWQTPAHVLLRDGEVRFSGTGEALNRFISKNF